MVERAQVDEGWWGGYFGPVQLVHYGAKVNKAGFDRYVKFLAAGNRPARARPAHRHLLRLPQARRHADGGAETRRPGPRRPPREATPQRGGLRDGHRVAPRSQHVQTVFFFARPPYPTSVQGTTLEGFQALAKHMPGIDAPALHSKYQQAMRAFTEGRAAA